jgi:hypothetical protein
MLSIYSAIFQKIYVKNINSGTKDLSSNTTFKKYFKTAVST